MENNQLGGIGALRFGIIGTGSIANTFAKGCALTEGAAAYAVVSRSLEKAKAFAKSYQMEKAYDSMDAMLNDPAVDCVYVATPHTQHFENCRQAILAGKHVLCEKPMTLNRRDAESLFALAQEHGVYLMEALWSRFLPGPNTAKRWLKEGRIGQLKMMDFQFSFATDPAAAAPRLILSQYAGGSLYDLGVYTVSMASFFAGADPIDYQGFAEDLTPGVDAMAALALRYPGGILATMRSGITVPSPSRGILFGTEGRIEMDMFHMSPAVRLYKDDQLTDEYLNPITMPEGFSCEIRGFCDDIRAGLSHSQVISPESTIATMDVLGTMMKRFYPELYKDN